MVITKCNKVTITKKVGYPQALPGDQFFYVPGDSDSKQDFLTTIIKVESTVTFSSSFTES